jgi:hypothetical protein
MRSTPRCVTGTMAAPAVPASTRARLVTGADVARRSSSEGSVSTDSAAPPRRDSHLRRASVTNIAPTAACTSRTPRQVRPVAALSAGPCPTATSVTPMLATHVARTPSRWSAGVCVHKNGTCRDARAPPATPVRREIPRSSGTDDTRASSARATTATTAWRIPGVVRYRRTKSVADAPAAMAATTRANPTAMVDVPRLAAISRERRASVATTPTWSGARNPTTDTAVTCRSTATASVATVSPTASFAGAVTIRRRRVSGREASSWLLIASPLSGRGREW